MDFTFYFDDFELSLKLVVKRAPIITTGNTITNGK